MLKYTNIKGVYILKEIALIGPTACGKSSLAIEIAKECEACVLSLDSLSIYKEIDISSAKPSLKERKEVEHFGIDEIYPNEHFNVSLFFEIYKKTKKELSFRNKNLIIVGGSSFYLKAMMEGLSPSVSPSEKTYKKLEEILKDLKKAFEFIKIKDPVFASKITKGDVYRIGKWYEIFLESGEIATRYFSKYKREPVIGKIPVFCISMDKEILKERIKRRTSMMIKEGVVEETFYLEKKYTRAVKPLKAIGPKECLEYLDGKLTLKEMEEKISLNTVKLAKRQITFNKTQFKEVVYGNSEEIKEKIKKIFN